MFTGRTRRHGQRQEAETPEPGSDSTYGVRSLGDSDWGSVHGLTTGSDLDEEQNLEEADATGSEDVQMQESTPTSHTEPLVDTEFEAEPSPSSPIITSPTSPIVTDHIEGYYRHTLPDDLSEPSSPASFASMPSYISSSLSRTSSLGPDTGRIPYQYAYPGMGGSEELVMPTLNVFQAGSKTEEGRRRGIKVFLLGNEGQAGGFMEELRGRDGVTQQIEGGQWTLGGTMGFTISFGSSDEVEMRLENTYQTLNGALHPDPSPALRGEVHDLISSYGLKSDWVHLVVVLDDRDTSSLSDIVPIIISPPISQADDPIIEAVSSPLGSPHAIPDPTPRPGVEGLSYFPPQDDLLHLDLVSLLINTLHSPDKVRSASTTKFLSWRQSRRDLSSSQTSASHSHEHSHESSSYEAAPMPTLARVQGGGEWEATLSRRLANRRQSHSQSPTEDTSKRGRRRSTASRPKVPKARESCGPLFPFSPSSNPSDPKGVGLGISELMEKTFGEIRRRWKWGLVAAAAVALVVGWNWSTTSEVRLSTCI